MLEQFLSFASTRPGVDYNLKEGIIINKRPFGFGLLNDKQKRSIPPEVSLKRRTKRRRGNKGKRKK